MSGRQTVADGQNFNDGSAASYTDVRELVHPSTAGEAPRMLATVKHPTRKPSKATVKLAVIAAADPECVLP